MLPTRAGGAAMGTFQVSGGMVQKSHEQLGITCNIQSSQELSVVDSGEGHFSEGRQLHSVVLLLEGVGGGGTRLISLHLLAKEILLWAELLPVRILTYFVPGYLNVLAEEGRNFARVVSPPSGLQPDLEVMGHPIYRHLCHSIESSPSPLIVSSSGSSGDPGRFLYLELE